MANKSLLDKTKNLKNQFQKVLILIVFVILILACTKEETSTPPPSVNVPTLTTASISSITSTSATSGGVISSDGGSAIISRGICWSTNTNPTIELSTKTSEGIGIGSFSSFISGITVTASTTFYIRAYATNSKGTAYGNEVSFVTTASNANVPTLTTTSISSITNISATSGGIISSDGGSAVAYRGVCWSFNPNPTIELNTKTSDGVGIGSFVSSISGLMANVNYYVRAYATNSKGTAYGNQIIFIAKTPTTNCGNIKDIDNNIYPSITIGTQCWMQENLNVTRYRNGDPILHVQDPTQWEKLTTGAWCYKNNLYNEGAKFYNWYAVNDPRGLAPVGWHVPSDAEWTTLTTFLGGESVAGAKMKAAPGWWNPSYTDEDNNSGFMGIKAGFRSYNGSFNSSNGSWWCTSEGVEGSAWYRFLDDNSSKAYRNNYYKASGFSVRCVKD